MSPYSNTTSIPSDRGIPVNRSFSVDQTSDAFGTESKNLNESFTSSDSIDIKSQSHDQVNDEIESQLDFEAMAKSIHISMKSHMEFMQAAWKQMMENHTAMLQDIKDFRQEFKESQTKFRQEIKDSRREFKESQVAMQNDIKIIKHDLHDPNGHLAITMTKSEERIMIAIKELIAKWEEKTLAEIDEKISKNNAQLTKIMGIGIIIWSAVVLLGLFLVA